MGMPGVGKGTQAARLQGRPGGAARLDRGHPARGGPETARRWDARCGSSSIAGALVPDELIGELIAERLGRTDAAGRVHPRRLPAGPLEQVDDPGSGARGAWRSELDGVFLLTAPEEEIVRRLSGRRICPGCGAVYHLEQPAAELGGRLRRVRLGAGPAAGRHGRGDPRAAGGLSRADAAGRRGLPASAACCRRSTERGPGRRSSSGCGPGWGSVSRMVLKSPAEIAIMDEANRIVRRILDELARA